MDAGSSWTGESDDAALFTRVRLRVSGGVPEFCDQGSLPFVHGSS